MPNPEALAVVQAAISLTRTHRHAPALAVLDVVMKGRICIDQMLNFAEPSAPNCSLAAPAAPFGQPLAVTFDDAMTPVKWKAFTDAKADSGLREGCLDIWRVYVIPRFDARYGVVVGGLP